MAELVLLSAMGKLESLLVDKAIPLPAGVKQQIHLLRNDLNMTLDIINNSGLSGKKLREGSICHHWMSEVLDMAHDADVAIDIVIFNLEKSRKKKGGLLRRSASILEKVLHLDHNRIQIDTIREKIESIKEYAQTARWESSSRRSPSVQPRRWDPWVEDSDVVGLNKDVDFLLEKVIFNEARRTRRLCVVYCWNGGCGEDNSCQAIIQS